jgi:hypothetical protein
MEPFITVCKAQTVALEEKCTDLRTAILFLSSFKFTIQELQSTDLIQKRLALFLNV